MTRPHTFSGNTLDRAERERRDPAWIARRERDPASLFLPLRRLDVLARDDGGALRLAWQTGRRLARLGVDGPKFLLGLRDGAAHFALDVSDADDALTQDGGGRIDAGSHIDGGARTGGAPRFVELREASVLLPAAEAGIAAQARANLDWHARHQFCSVCGQPSQSVRGGQQRTCGGCGAHHFPRTDPVVIVVVSRGDRCLLGQSRGRLARRRMFSALAGFVDQGESIEEAVRREVAEEAGVQVGRVTYHSSQPWPFPSSLMIGCHADALTTELRPDDVEMQAVRWFPRPQVRRALANADPKLRVPAQFAIAHHLIKAWAERA